MKTLKHQVDAMRIYKRIHQIKKDTVEEFKKQGFIKKLENSYQDLSKTHNTPSACGGVTSVIICKYYEIRKSVALRIQNTLSYGNCSQIQKNTIKQRG